MYFVTQASDPLTQRDRLLAATYACVARFGLGKTTVEDVVKEAGVSRATIYRQFPGGRDELLLETVGWELANYFTRLADHVRDAPNLAELLERGLAFAHRSVTEHEVLRKIMDTEPERLLPLLTTETARRCRSLPISCSRTCAATRPPAACDPVSTSSAPRTTSPVRSSPSSARPAAGISTTPGRSPNWCAMSCSVVLLPRRATKSSRMRG
jgi:AcrR family transcriptional regulator